MVSSSEPSVVGDRVGAVGHGGAADHVVDEAVLQGLLRGEPPVAVGVLLDLLDGLTRVPRLELVERSEVSRVGKECRSRCSPYHYKKKTSSNILTLRLLILHL